MDRLLHDAAAAIERDATLGWRSDRAFEARITGFGSRRDADERLGEGAESPTVTDR